MYVTIFVILLTLSFVLIGLGLIIREHTELSLVGFVFLFLLSFMIINENITIVTGTNITSNFTYTTNGDNLTLLTSSEESLENVYTTVELEGTLSHSLGYWLAVCSVIGFIGVILGIKNSKEGGY